MGIFLIGIATAFNILVIFKKIELKRYQDATFDSIFLVTLTFIFGGSFAGMTVATISSAFISIYFLFNAPTFLNFLKNVKFKKSTEVTDNDVEDSIEDDILARYGLHKVKFN